MAAKLSGGTGFCTQVHFDFIRVGVMRGGLMASPPGALFFPASADLFLFEGPLHAIGLRVRFLPAAHPLQAIDDIPAESAGGRVRDELFGDGFARWPRRDGEHFPDWMELSHDNEGQCHGHDFVHHPIGPTHQAFVRPKWPITMMHRLWQQADEARKKLPHHPGRG